MGEVQSKPGASFQESPSSGVARMRVIPPAMSHDMCEVL